MFIYLKYNINNFVVIGLTTSREKLYERINERVDQMVELGLVEEVKKLFEKNDEKVILYRILMDK